MAGIGIFQPSAHEVQVRHCRYSKSYQVEQLEPVTCVSGVRSHTVVIRWGIARFLPVL